MIWNQLNAKSVVLLYEYMHRNVYNAHQLCVINDAQLMTESVIDDALLQAMPHIKHTLIQFFSIMKFCLVYSLPHFYSQVLQSSGFISGLLGACDIDIHPFNRDRLSVKTLSSHLKTLS